MATKEATPSAQQLLCGLSFSLRRASAASLIRRREQVRERVRCLLPGLAAAVGVEVHGDRDTAVPQAVRNRLDILWPGIGWRPVTTPLYQIELAVQASRSEPPAPALIQPVTPESDVDKANGDHILQDLRKQDTPTETAP